MMSQRIQTRSRNRTNVTLTLLSAYTTHVDFNEGVMVNTNRKPIFAKNPGQQHPVRSCVNAVQSVLRLLQNVGGTAIVRIRSGRKNAPGQLAMAVQNAAVRLASRGAIDLSPEVISRCRIPMPCELQNAIAVAL